MREGPLLRNLKPLDPNVPDYARQHSAQRVSEYSVRELTALLLPLLTPDELKTFRANQKKHKKGRSGKKK